ncbi:MAG TPA: hypothetical protein VNI61_06665, partial [Gemmatimonadales bacterium]|nr:hypothetical protein [Gemmatimonadales bacterium]
MRGGARGPVLAALTLVLPGASLPAQASGPEGALVIRGGTVHTLVGPPIEHGTVVIEGGKIAAVGAGVAVPAGAR